MNYNKYDKKEIFQIDTSKEEEEENSNNNNQALRNNNGTSFFTSLRHEFQKTRKLDTFHNSIGVWRKKERMKTVRVALVLCLNIGTDPPDVVKTSPCARDECWIKTSVLPPTKALRQVGETLRQQYERWQKRALYKLSLDPTLDDVKKVSMSLRHSARSERVLFHYNGHGVPKPTHNGEIWVFNKGYTQYIPLAVENLQTWLGHPVMYVFDCSGASVLKPFFQQNNNNNNNTSTINMNDSNFGVGLRGDNNNNNNDNNLNNEFVLGQQFGSGMNKNNNTNGNSNDIIALFATGANTWLPTNPEFPADIFTACLTTPLKIALRWFLKRNPLSTHSVTLEMLDNIPGHLQERKTPLGELNWVFTAITDTIAWNVLPRNEFQRLFRQDLLVASLFRNFLLAERIMTSLNCPPSSIPSLPSTAQHHLWDAWDLAVETCLAQLPSLLRVRESNNNNNTNANPMHPQTGQVPKDNKKGKRSSSSSSQGIKNFRHCSFFTEQLTAFEVWLEYASEEKGPPEQLPIVLQILLSQLHRFRALVLLAKFLDLGPWAVDHALSVGIFPYVLKLLQSSAIELRNVLVFIWTKILASDRTCQSDLLKDNGHVYFLRHLQAAHTEPEQRVLSAFVLSVIMDNENRAGQNLCLSHQLLKVCSMQLDTSDPLLRQWLCLCLSKVWEKYFQGQKSALDHGIANEIVAKYLNDDSPEVRAAVVYAVGTLVSVDNVEERTVQLDEYTRRVYEYKALEALTKALALCQDLSVLVRHELLLALSRLFYHPRHLIKLQLVANSLEKMEKLRSEVTIPKKISKKARALLGLEAADDTKEDDASSGSSGNQGINNTEEPVLDPLLLEQKNLEKVIGSTEATQCYINIWKVIVQMEKNDPFEKISNLSSYLLRQLDVKAEFVETRRRSGGGDGSGPPPPSTLKRQMSAPNLKGSASKLATLTSSNISAQSKNGTNRNKDDKQNLPNQRVLSPSNETYDDLTRSQKENVVKAKRMENEAGVFFRYCYQRFSHPLLLQSESKELKVQFKFSSPSNDNEDEWDALNEDNVHYDWLRKRNRKIVKTAMTMRAEKSRYNNTPNNGAEDGLNISSMMVDVENLSGVETSKFEQTAILDNECEKTSKLLFHPYEPVLVAADSRDGISVWNFEDGVKLKQFSNRNRPGTRITTMKWLNSDEPSLLAVGSDDGVIRIWSGKQRRYKSSRDSLVAKKKVQLVYNSLENAGLGISGIEMDDPTAGDRDNSDYTLSSHRTKENIVGAWNAAPDLIPNTRASGMVTTWQQQNGHLYVGGNSRFIRLWDLCSEKCSLTMQSGSTGKCITSMTSMWDQANNSFSGEVLTGFSDGAIRMFDSRAGEGNSAVVMSNEVEHRNWIVNVSLQRGHGRILFTGSVIGDIKTWDVRNALAAPIHAIEADTMTTMTVQDYAPLIATGSHKQYIKILNTSGAILSTIKYHDGFLGQRIGPVSCLTFHPHLPIVASGATDSIIAIYKSASSHSRR